MSFVAWHTESQAPPETGSHGTGSTTYGILDPESLQIDHYAFPPGRSESSPVQVLVEHPSGNTTLSVRNQVPGLSRPGQLTRKWHLQEKLPREMLNTIGRQYCIDLDKL